MCIRTFSLPSIPASVPSSCAQLVVSNVSNTATAPCYNSSHHFQHATAPCCNSSHHFQHGHCTVLQLQSSLPTRPLHRVATPVIASNTAIAPCYNSSHRFHHGYCTVLQLVQSSLPTRPLYGVTTPVKASNTANLPCYNSSLRPVPWSSI